MSLSSITWTLDWQTTAALLCVLSAGAYLLRRAIGLGGAAGCGSCRRCPASEDSNGSTNLVTLSAPSSPRRTVAGRDQGRSSVPRD